MKDDIQEYLKNYFQKVAIPDDQKPDNLNEYITSKLTRKSYRRKKPSAGTLEAIRNKISLSIKESAPVHLVIPFGGYKHFWNPSQPEPDWAELFNFQYLTDLVLPIAGVYKPGVILEYISEDLILNRMNNYPTINMDKYSEIFQKLIDWQNGRLPKNIVFKYFRVGDKCDKDKLILEVEKMLPERLKAFEKLSQAEKDLELHRSVRSVFWNGDIDLTKLNDNKKRQRMIESRVIELAYYDTEARPEFLGDYLYGGDHICICFSFGLSKDNTADDLTLGSAHGSIVDFWIGRGILEHNNKKIYPRIVSKEQYQKLKPNLADYKISPEILPYINFQSIEVNKIE